jgi:alpha-tubulin suppressor-like RCC1 family protein
MPRLASTFARELRVRLAGSLSSSRLPRRGAAALLAGVLAAGCSGDAPTSPESDLIAQPAGPATASVVTAGFIQASADGFSSCAVAAQGRAWCWGSNAAGELGDGTTTGHLVPQPVAGDLRFRMVANNSHRACGITTDNRAYCWGSEAVGDGTNVERHTPTAVVGGHRFFQLDVGSEQTCAVSDPDRRVYCWSSAQLTPTLLPGNLRFGMVSGGETHFCGVTTDDLAYCWGWNRFGQLGDGGDTGVRPAPVPVAGGHLFHQIDAGFQHTCAVTTTHRAFCWGYGKIGQIGDGKTLLRFTPRAVAGRISFDRVSAGGGQTCGEATSGLTYCWGSNENGGLGNGTKTPGLTPVQVTGGHTFVQVTAGGWHACGVTRAKALYCWGRGEQVGNGESPDLTVPTLIARPM